MVILQVKELSSSNSSENNENNKVETRKENKTQSMQYYKTENIVIPPHLGNVRII